MNQRRVLAALRKLLEAGADLVDALEEEPANDTPRVRGRGRGKGPVLLRAPVATAPTDELAREKARAALLEAGYRPRARKP